MDWSGYPRGQMALTDPITDISDLAVFLSADNAELERNMALLGLFAQAQQNQLTAALDGMRYTHPYELTAWQAWGNVTVTVAELLAVLNTLDDPAAPPPTLVPVQLSRAIIVDIAGDVSCTLQYRKNIGGPISQAFFGTQNFSMHMDPQLFTDTSNVNMQLQLSVQPADPGPGQ